MVDLSICAGFPVNPVSYDSLEAELLGEPAPS